MTAVYAVRTLRPEHRRGNVVRWLRSLSRAGGVRCEPLRAQKRHRARAHARSVRARLISIERHEACCYASLDPSLFRCERTCRFQLLDREVVLIGPGQCSRPCQPAVDVLLVGLSRPLVSVECSFDLLVSFEQPRLREPGRRRIAFNHCVQGRECLLRPSEGRKEVGVKQSGLWYVRKSGRALARESQRGFAVTTAERISDLLCILFRSTRA